MFDKLLQFLDNPIGTLFGSSGSALSGPRAKKNNDLPLSVANDYRFPKTTTESPVYGPVYDPLLNNSSYANAEQDINNYLAKYGISSGGGGGYSAPVYTPQVDYYEEAMKAYTKATEDWQKTIEDWKRTLPDAPDAFSFDRELARKEIMKPKEQGGSGITEYYSGLLKDFVTEQDAKFREYGNQTVTTLGDLAATTDYQKKRVQREVQDAISRNERGLATRGLLDSSYRTLEGENISQPANDALAEFLRKGDVEKNTRIRQAVEQLGQDYVIKNGIASLNDINAAYSGVNRPSGNITGVYQRELDRYNKTINQEKLKDIENELGYRENVARQNYQVTVADPYQKSLNDYYTKGTQLGSYPSLSQYL